MLKYLRTDSTNNSVRNRHSVFGSFPVGQSDRVARPQINALFEKCTICFKAGYAHGKRTLSGSKPECGLLFKPRSPKGAGVFLLVQSHTLGCGCGTPKVSKVVSISGPDRPPDANNFVAKCSTAHHVCCSVIIARHSSCNRS